MGKILPRLWRSASFCVILYHTTRNEGVKFFLCKSKNVY